MTQSIRLVHSPDDLNNYDVRCNDVRIHDSINLVQLYSRSTEFLYKYRSGIIGFEEELNNLPFHVTYPDHKYLDTEVAKIARNKMFDISYFNQKVLGRPIEVSPQSLN